MSVTQPQVEAMKEDKATRILREALGMDSLEASSKSDIVLALGRLLSLKVERGSAHEVTKEIRRALELILQSPLNKEIPMAVYTNPPFESDILNDVYRRLLRRLLEIAVSEASELSPMWRRRLVNLIVENIYNITAARDTIPYKKRIIEILREG